MSTDARTGWSFVLDEPATVLVADDDPIFREFAVVHLGSPSASIVTAVDGEDAWAKLTSQPVDIALIDVGMPRLDGFQLARRIRADAALQHLPFLIVTGREDIASIDTAYQIGANSFATKPVNWRQLTYHIRHVLRTARIEADARLARHRAEQALRLKNNVLTCIRHEFRTPLSSVIGFSDLLANRGRQHGDGELAEQATYIREAGRRLLQSLTSMLNCAELLAGTYTLQEDLHDLGRIVAGAVAQLSPLAAERGMRIASPDFGETLILCDRAQITVLVENVLTNAILHSGGTTVAITMEGAGEAGLVLAIADDGAGIAPDRLDACLEPFSQADMSLTRPTEGLGLGLPVARQIAGLHAARFALRPASPHGLVVEIGFPPWRVQSDAAPTVEPEVLTTPRAA